MSYLNLFRKSVLLTLTTMRTINFRAIWKQDKTWLKGFSVNTEGRVWVRDSDTLNSSYDVTDEVELMQFTGLYDVNGKEIYEGDIIKHRYFSMKGVAKVYWNDDEACFLAVEPNGTRVILRPNSEVIGNIYENPELLEVLSSLCK